MWVPENTVFQSRFSCRGGLCHCTVVVYIVCGFQKALCSSLGFPIEVDSAKDIQVGSAEYTGCVLIMCTLGGCVCVSVSVCLCVCTPKSIHSVSVPQ